MGRRVGSERERPVTALLRDCFQGLDSGDPGYYPAVSYGDSVVIAGMGRRFVALTLDWLMSWAVGSMIFDQANGRPFWLMLVFYLEIALLTWLTGASAGQRILGLSVRSFPEQLPLGLGKVLLRTLLILLVIPAVVFDSDGRGLHDRIVRSAVYRRVRQS